ncbi:Cell division control protein 6-like protein [Trichoplax sp. H2]|nr:Cell division control protein 6-like protein [Trichoplax sp. H2]|eukprot:RDD40673.1 Cell division control protein 6-like protein [Trichoplax sp. H2]
MQTTNILSYGFRCRKARTTIEKWDPLTHRNNTSRAKRKLEIDRDDQSCKKRLKETLINTSEADENPYLGRKFKNILSTSIDDSVICRNHYLEEIGNFIKQHVDHGTAASMYISGAPGTGKTLCLKKVAADNQDLAQKAKVIYLNCMTFKKADNVHNQILSKLLGSETVLSARAAVEKLRRAISSSGSMIVLIIDEIDQLECKGQEVLYTLFELPSIPRSKLILIGVANSLDLTDRSLPRLNKLEKYKPKLLHFPPYTKDEIVCILDSRMSMIKSSDSVTSIDKSAFEYCARKVSAVSGDIRKALDICRRAIEIVEKRANRNNSNNGNNPDATVRISDVAGVISEVYGSRILPTMKTSSEPTIPLQQKLLVGALLLAIKKIRGVKEITIAKLFECYRNLCKKRQIQTVYESEITNLCSLLEARGILRLKNNKEVRFSKVCLAINEAEVAIALKDQTLISSILNDDL